MTLPTTQNVARPLAEGYDALLTYGDQTGEDLYLQTAVSPDRPIEITTAPQPSQGPQLGLTPEEFRPGAGLTFARSDLTGGEGLAYAHRIDGSDLDRTRFWDSLNIDTSPPDPGDRPTMRLLQATGRNISSANANLLSAMRYVPSQQYNFIDGSSVKWTADPFAASPSVNSQALGATGTGIAVVGNTIYASTAAALWRKVGTGAWGSWVAQGYDGLWSAKGHLIGSEGAYLYDISLVDGTETTLKQLAAGETWTAVCDAGSVILAAATDGQVYSFVPDGVDLLLKAEAPIALGEVVYSMISSQQVVLVGTGEVTISGGYIGRLWAFQVVGIRLREGQVLKQWGEGATAWDSRPMSMAMSRDSLFAGVLDTTGFSSLWRYDLATAGLSRDLDYPTGDGPVTGLEVIDEKPYALLKEDGGWRPTGVYAADGYLITPLADFYRANPKSWVGVRIDHDAITSDEQIDLYYSTNPAAIEDPDHASWTLAKSITSGQFTDEEPLDDVQGRYLAMKLVLTANTAATVTPVVRSISARSLEQLVDIAVSIPVNVSDVVERRYRTPFFMKGRGEAVWQALRSHEGKAAQLDLLRSDVGVRGNVDSVSARIPIVGPRGSVTYIAMVTVSGVKV